MSKLKKIAIVISSLAFILAVGGFFILPDMLYIQLFSKQTNPETGKLGFLIAGLLIILLSSSMCFFTEKEKKWLTIASALLCLFVGGIVYNYVVM